MSPINPDQNQTPLPLRADPAAGALVGTFLLAACLGGPVGLVIALVVWIVYEALRQSLAKRSAKPRGSHK